MMNLEIRTPITKGLRGLSISPYNWCYTAQLPYYFLKPCKKVAADLPRLPIRDCMALPCDETITLMFAGDLMQLAYDRSPRLSAALKQLTQRADYFIVNCEAPVVDKPCNHKVKRNVNFSMPLSYLESILTQIGLEANQFIIGVANNHSRDEVQHVFDNGVTLLQEKLGVNTVGQYGNLVTTIKTNSQLNLGFSAWTDLMNGERFLEKRKVVNRQIDISNNNWRQQKEESAIDFLVGLPHWDREYKHAPHPNTRKAAYQFINKGFDLLVGCHPHVVQPLEKIADKYCCYSMGNFCSVDKRYETKLIPIFEVVISAKSKQVISYEMHFFSQIEKQGVTHIVPLDSLQLALQKKYQSIIQKLYYTDTSFN